MGALVTLDLPDDSPVLALPWIITFGPLGDDEEWEPVVCGPYERAHALSLAETVVADEELMAVVEPVLPHTSVEEIRGEIASAKVAAQAELEEGGYNPADDEYGAGAAGGDEAGGEAMRVAVDDEYDAEDAADAAEAADNAEYDSEEYDDLDDLEEVEPSPPPSPAEVRAGFARIAARLTSGS